jgi:hypothetical protein
MSPEELEGEIQVGRIQRTDTGYEVTVANRAELFRKGRLIAVVTVDGEPIEWNPALHSDPRIKANENRGEGAGFLFSPYFHKKGLFLQNVIKRGIISTINLTYKQILRFYDKDAFVFEDPRLNKLRLFCKTAAILVVLGGAFDFTAGLIVVAFFLGRLTAIGMTVGAGRSVSTARRMAASIAISLLAVLVAQLALWAWGRAEGGTLGPVDFLAQTYGVLVLLELLLAGGAAWLKAS